MSLATDVRAFADAALEQAKQAIDAASARLSGVADDTSDRAGETMDELRGHGETLLVSLLSRDLSGLTATAKADFAAIKSTAEPFLAQVTALGAALVEKADDVVGDLVKDPRVAHAYETVEGVANTVVETVNERVVAPALSFIGFESGKTAASTAKWASATSSAAAPKKPTAKATAARKPTAKATAARKPTAKATAAKATAARKPTAKATAAKASAKRASVTRTAKA